MSVQPQSNHHSAKWITQSAIIAGLYVLFTFLSSLAGLSSGAIQLRISEALTILPVFTPAAIPGLFIGCLLANILTGCALWDIILGSLITLVSALATRYLRSKKILKYFPPIFFNTLGLPLILSFVYHFEGSLLYFAVTIFIGEFLSCGVLGAVLYRLLVRYQDRIPWIK